MKQYHEPIQVEVGDDGLPYSFRWRNRAWRVLHVVDRWVLQAGWWRKEGEEKRDYVLVEAEGMDGAVTAVELYLAGEGDGVNARIHWVSVLMKLGHLPS